MFHARNHPLTHYTLRSLFLSLSITHNNTSHSYTFSRTNTSIAFCFSSYVSAAVFLSLLSSFFFLFFFPITIYSVFFLIALLLLFFFPYMALCTSTQYQNILCLLFFQCGMRDLDMNILIMKKKTLKLR